MRTAARSPLLTRTVSAVSPRLEAIVRPLDAGRREILRATVRVPLLGSALRSVEWRLALLASASVILSLACTLFAPGLLFVLGPVLLGVPHVASDIRYLVLRQPRVRVWTMTLTLISVALVVLRAAEMVAPRRFPFAAVEVGAASAWIALAFWMGFLARRAQTVRRNVEHPSLMATIARWRPLRATLAPLPIAIAVAMALAYPDSARLLFAYGHNLVAPIIWIALFRGNKARAALPIAVAGAGVCLLLSGVTLAWVHFDEPWVRALAREARIAMPTLAPATALAVGLSYVFLQAVHYSIWLVWIPQEHIRGNATLTFRMSLRAARRDFGAWGLALIGAASLVMMAASLVAVHRTRHFYLSIATFHAYLELACLAFLWMQRQEAIAPRPLCRAEQRAR